MVVARHNRQRFFPLDEELGLLPGIAIPSLQEAMTRLGSQMPFDEAVKEIGFAYQTRISQSTTLRIIYENGQASEVLAK